MTPESLSELAQSAAREIYDDYLAIREQENCRWDMDFVPGILPHLAEGRARELKIPKAQRAEFIAHVIEVFNLFSRSCHRN